MPDQLHPNGAVTPSVCPDKTSLAKQQPSASVLRPFADEPGRWESECRRVRRVLDEHRLLNGADMAAATDYGRIDERTAFGWVRWQASHDEAMPAGPLQIGVISPTLSRIARVARRWLTRRPPLLRVFGTDVPTALAALLSLVTGLYVMARHPMPMGVVVPAMLLTPIYVSTLPRRLDTAAHRVVRVIEAGPAREYLQRLAALHAQVAQAAADAQISELTHAARLGHRILWDTAGLLTKRGVWPCCDERLLTYERLYTELAQQALEAAAAQQDLKKAVPRPGSPTRTSFAPLLRVRLPLHHTVDMTAVTSSTDS